MNTFVKESYEAPTALVVDVKAEGIICSSEIEAVGEGYIEWED